MSTFEFKLPDIGEGVTEGEVVEWHVKPGDAVEEDQPMVEVMTDKATVTIGAPRKGTIAELKYPVGGTAKVGSVLVVLDLDGSRAAAPKAAAPAPKPEPAKPEPPRPAHARSSASEGPAATAVGDIREGLPGSSFFADRAPVKRTNGHSAPEAAGYYAEKPLATPATRKLARELGVDLRTVRPSGTGGRVTREDVHAFASGGASHEPHAESAPRESAPKQAPVAIAPSSRSVEDERKPFVGVRRRIAERMQHSKNTAAHFTFVEECNCDRLVELRTKMRAAAEARGVKLTYLPFIVKAVVAALKRHPVLNSALDEATNELVTRRSYHIGVAAATDMGLMVPVLRDADRMSLLEIASEIDRLGEGARKGSLAPTELSGSTFTITSLGKQGGLFATPILNFPEVGILGVHLMKERPVVRDGAIAIGQVMLLSLSFDHRIVDGHVGAAFAYEIIGYLEEPESLFLHM
jgi:pyruvate dehydrogenase E2 component (dihydrolipoamide acetyltransferase)